METVLRVYTLYFTTSQILNVVKIENCLSIEIHQPMNKLYENHPQNTFKIYTAD